LLCWRARALRPSEALLAARPLAAGVVPASSPLEAA
jgi:hypothetical protein